MNSFYAKLFLAVQKQLKEQIPEIKTIDQNFGQVAAIDFKQADLLPAIFIDFSKTNYSEISTSSQMGNAQIEFELYCNTALSNTIEENLIYFELEDKICKVLQGFSTNFCTPLQRISSKSKNFTPEQTDRIRSLKGCRTEDVGPYLEVEYSSLQLYRLLGRSFVFTTEFTDEFIGNDSKVLVNYRFNGSLT